MEYFGITETYDPAQNYSWVDYLKVGNILITKNLTDKFIETVTKPEIQDKVIIHLTCTGFGGTVLEPNIPTIEESVNQMRKLLDKGFPEEQIVLRMSPVIPTENGIKTILKVLDAFEEFGIQRIRFSTLNVYKHVKKRFDDAHIGLPYESYSCSQEMRDTLINTILSYFKISTNDIWNSDICAEVDLQEGLLLKRACVSQKDVKILKIEDKISLVGSGKQRASCMCPDNKRQIIRCRPGRCKHGCLYCYWKGIPK